MSKKLWQKENTITDEWIEIFTVGNDKDFDMLLAKYDVMETLAHTEMLAQVGLLTTEEKKEIHSALNEIKTSIDKNEFIIEDGMEDVHSQIEFQLVEKIGDAGKKIHSGRSRNDQVILDIKLYLKDAITDIADKTASLFKGLIQLSEQHKNVLLPGFTHLQIAMPSSFGLWFSAYAECLSEDLEMLYASYKIADKNPLGSGAGYGSSFPLNRKTTTELLGFSKMHVNAINAQMSRGRVEKFVGMAISSISATLSRLSMDICLFMNQCMGFITFPSHLTTGSSIMPHKKNPDIFELIRGKCNRIQSIPNELALLMTNLPSGYHRDVQLTKEILFPAINTLTDCLSIATHALPQIQVNPTILKDEKYKYLFTVEAVNDLVNQGTSFRDAYVQVGNEVENGNFEYQNFDLNHHTHEGSMGNLCLDEIQKDFDEIYSKFGKGVI